MKQSKFYTDASHISQTRRLKIATSSAFAQSAQLAETLQNALWQTDQKRQFVIYEHNRSPVLFFSVCGWKQEDVFLYRISTFCVYGQTGIVQISGVFLSFFQNKLSR